MDAILTSHTPLHLSERHLVRLALDLGVDHIGGSLSQDERSLVMQASTMPRVSGVILNDTRRAILAGDDPLGTILSAARPVISRRTNGAFYTPATIVDPMVEWILKQDPDRVIDPGCGSGRFSAALARRRRTLAIMSLDVDPVATILTRASLQVLGAQHATVCHTDYTTFDIPYIGGRTAFVGNPPYVRHHTLSRDAKAWATRAGARLGIRVSGLAGLHAYFFLATAVAAKPGDVGCFVTSAEWLDVNYGSCIRNLLLNQLGGAALWVIDPQAIPFEDVMTTAAIACFEVGTLQQEIQFHPVATVADLLDPKHGRAVPRQTLTNSQRWTSFLRAEPISAVRNGEIPLRAVARVHRGIATGANDFFVLLRERARELGIEQWCRPVITGAEEILQADGVIRDSPDRRVLLDVPAQVDRAAHPELDAYLRLGERSQDGKPAICDRYITSHRRPWWNLGLSSTPPIVATYMARQAPVFALNQDGLAIVNIAHGIFPRFPLSPGQLTELVRTLNSARSSFRGNGRTYHGGLEKFEPREMESLLIPPVVTGLL